jgi:hypothetical protein
VGHGFVKLRDAHTDEKGEVSWAGSHSYHAADRDLTERPEEQTLAARRALVIGTLVGRARQLARDTEAALKAGRELRADERDFLLGLIDVTLDWYDDLEGEPQDG